MNKIKIKSAVDQTLLLLSKKESLICGLSYCSIIGWSISFIINEYNETKNPLCLFHLKQSLGLFLINIAIFFMAQFFIFIPHLIYVHLFFYAVLFLINLSFISIGIWNSVLRKPKELPYIGASISFYLENILKDCTLPNSKLEPEILIL